MLIKREKEEDADKILALRKLEKNYFERAIERDRKRERIEKVGRESVPPDLTGGPVAH